MYMALGANLREAKRVVPVSQVGVAGNVVAGLLHLVVGLAQEPGDSLGHLRSE